MKESKVLKGKSFTRLQIASSFAKIVFDYKYSNLNYNRRFILSVVLS